MALATLVSGSVYLLLVSVIVLPVGAIVATVMILGQLGWYLCLIPAGVLVAAARRIALAWRAREQERPPSGISLSRIVHPRLWAVVEEVCDHVEQPLVDELQLTLEPGASARVEEGRRVLSVSLIYLEVLGTRELKSVIAHEIAHFAHRDGDLGRRVGETLRTLALAHDRLTAIGSVLRFPLRWYGGALMGFLASLRRDWELEADAFAAWAIGGDANARALRTTCWVSAAFQQYWRHAAVPVLQAGLRPPIAAGFGQFARSRTRSLPALVPDERPGPYDSHPALVERLRVLGQDPGVLGPSPSPAIALLDDLDRVEMTLLRGTAVEADALSPCSWTRATQTVFPPLWAHEAEKHVDQLAGITAAGLPSLLDDLDRGSSDSTDDEAADPMALISSCGCALAAALHASGWDVVTPPWAPVTLAHDGESIRPFEDVSAIWHSRLLRDQWAGRCSEAGISELELGRQPERDVSTALAPPTSLAPPTGLPGPDHIQVSIDDGLMRGPLQRFGPRLTLSDDRIVITHPALLRERLVIDRASLRAIIVDPATRRARRRFPVFDTSEWNDPGRRSGEPRGWFWADGRSARPTPLYSVRRRTPNVLILLAVPVPGPRVRRQLLHGPLKGETLVRLTLSVVDPSRVQAAAERFGYARVLTVQDLDLTSSIAHAAAA